MLSPVAETMLQVKKQGTNANRAGAQEGTKNVPAIPCIHFVSHNLKKVVERAEVKTLIIAAADKIAKMCRVVMKEIRNLCVLRIIAISLYSALKTWCNQLLWIMVRLT